MGKARLTTEGNRRGRVDRPYKSWELESVGFSLGSNLNWQKEEEDEREAAVAPLRLLIYNLAVIHELQASSSLSRVSLALLKLSARHEILIKECARRKRRE